MINQFEIWTDGGARGNPGPAAIGFVVKNNNQLIFKSGEFIGKTTNNIAEYTAVVKALEWLEKNCPIAQLSNCPIVFYLDSQLVVQQLNGKFKVKNIALTNLIINIKNFEAKFSGKITYQKIDREENYLADGLVNQALDSALSSR